MTRSQRKLVQSWIIGGIASVITIILVKMYYDFRAYIPLIIVSPIFNRLRSDAGVGKIWLFDYMSEKTKLFILIYCIFLGGGMAYYLSVKPKLVGNNVGVFMFLALLPLILVAIKAERQLFVQFGKENA